jgi:L-rhamnose mutarotase
MDRHYNASPISVLLTGIRIDTDAKFLDTARMSSEKKSPSSVSTNLLNQVPKLDGTNYHEWEIAMMNYLQAQGAWQFVMTQDTIPTDKALKLEWQDRLDILIGSIKFRSSMNVAAFIDRIPDKTPKKVWDDIKAEFKKTNISSIYSDFAKALDFKMTGNRDPNVDINELLTFFDRMKVNGCDISETLRAMITLSKIPQKWAHLISYIMSGVKKTDDLTMSLIKTYLQTEFDRPQSRLHSINRISAVSHKPKSVT